MSSQVRMCVTFGGKQYEVTREVSQEVFDRIAANPQEFGRLLESAFSQEMAESLRRQIVGDK